MRTLFAFLLSLSNLLLMPAALFGQEAAQEVVVEMVRDLPQDDENTSVELSILSRYAQVECGLARRVCQLAPEQVASLRELQSSKWLKHQLEQPPVGQVKILKGIGRFLGGQVVGGQQDKDRVQTVNRVRKQIDAQFATILTPQQLGDFQREKDAREEFRQEALAGVFVAVLDSQVFLTEEQRQALIPEIAQSTKSKDIYWQFYFQNQSYIPSFPQSALRKHLTADQIKSLSGLNAYTYMIDEVQAHMHGLHLQEFEDVAR